MRKDSGVDDKTKKVMAGFMTAAMIAGSVYASHIDDDDDDDSNTNVNGSYHGSRYTKDDSAPSDKVASSTGHSKGGLGSVIRSSAAS
jgi:hypothetical protein